MANLSNFYIDKTCFTKSQELNAMSVSCYSCNIQKKMYFLITFCDMNEKKERKKINIVVLCAGPCEPSCVRKWAGNADDLRQGRRRRQLPTVTFPEVWEVGQGQGQGQRPREMWKRGDIPGRGYMWPMALWQRPTLEPVPQLGCTAPRHMPAAGGCRVGVRAPAGTNPGAARRTRELHQQRGWPGLHLAACDIFGEFC